MSKLYIVGIGPGSADYLTFKAKTVAESADVLIGSQRALALFTGSHGEKIVLDSANIENSFKLAVSKVRDGKSVALLSTGDPGFSGVLKPILKPAKDIEIEVVPGISSVQLCAAKLQIPWDNADLVTLHGKGVSEVLLDVLDNDKPTIVLPHFEVDEIARFLIKSGVNPERKVAVCEKLSYPDERIVETSLKGILEEKFSYMCVMVVY